MDCGNDLVLTLHSGMLLEGITNAKDGLTEISMNMIRE